jgi:hypothetical protein
MESNPGFQHVTGRKFCRFFKASALEKSSYNELDEPKESTIKNQPRNSAIDGTDAVINFVVS